MKLREKRNKNGGSMKHRRDRGRHGTQGGGGKTMGHKGGGENQWSRVVGKSIMSWVIQGTRTPRRPLVTARWNVSASFPPRRSLHTPSLCLHRLLT